LYKSSMIALIGRMTIRASSHRDLRNRRPGALGSRCRIATKADGRARRAGIKRRLPSDHSRGIMRIQRDGGDSRKVAETHRSSMMGRLGVGGFHPPYDRQTGLRKPPRSLAGYRLVLAATVLLPVGAVRAGTESDQAEPTRWIAAQAVAYLEVPRPEVVLDR